MGVILREAGNGSFFMSDEIRGAVAHGSECSEGAIRKSLTILCNAGMLERISVPGTTKKQIRPTQKGYDWFRPKYV